MQRSEIRRANVRKLIEHFGGPGNLSSRLGYRNASFIVQMAGPNPIRDVTERTARKIEQELNLPNYALDHSEFEPLQADPGAAAAREAFASYSAPQSVLNGSVELVSRVAAEVFSALQSANVGVTAAKFGDIVGMVYEDAAIHNGEVRPAFIQQMVRLLR